MKTTQTALRPKRHSLVRPLVQQLHAYVPGEQPKITGLIKLNTNENPYPPSPKVLAAVQAATDARLRLYPNPTAQSLRAKLAQVHGCRPENLLVGNGSDELLALATRAFVEPRAGWPASGFIGHYSRPKAQARTTIQFFTPSYSLYPVLADIHGAARNGFPLNPDFTLPKVRELQRSRAWDFDAALTFVTTPNAPSGRAYPTTELAALCRSMRGVVVLDEAYVDFSSQNALPLALKLPNVLVARTFSKAFSLCFLRVGYFVGDAALIAALDKVRDSYNVNGLAQVAAEATLDDLPYYQANFQKIIATRQKLGEQLAALDFKVLPSETNFLLVKPPVLAASAWLEQLRERKILVRWFDLPAVRDFLRITIGTPTETEALVRAARQIREAARAH